MWDYYEAYNDLLVLPEIGQSNVVVIEKDSLWTSIPDSPFELASFFNSPRKSSFIRPAGLSSMFCRHWRERNGQHKVVSS